ncbi:PspC domain-containing protein [uncultured Marixanthomonas sp.]|uniref:PspC domain-containing protein n=1 Tax=uncultured Marixanthomonas sp. TaxID=757245 RepID=UPI0030D94DC0|tara:strand:- start:56205 stop:57992 length:1788 start_codon:yes stop_codon:yes gene_type:complete
MKKTVNINLAGTFFHIDEDAFGKLSRYLDAIKRSLTDPNGSDEIMRDIEARIAELFSEKIETKAQVISLKELDEVIAVMGQPEDYQVDEEMFEDVPPTQKSSRRRSSTRQQLFRDIDNKFISGVSSGLGHYLGIDAIWIRLLWIILTILSQGVFIVVYIIFWILVPAAVTTSDKLRMTGEPVNISNIERKFKEGYDTVADKVKNADYDKYGQKVKKGTSGFFDTLGKIIVTLFTIFVKFLGLLFILISISALIGLIVSLFTLGTVGFWGTGEVMEYITMFDTTGTPIWIISLLTLFAVGIPFFVLFILGLKMLINNLKSIGTKAKITLLIVWFISLIILGILGIKQATQRAYDGEDIAETVLPVKKGDTLQLKMRADSQYEYEAHRHGGLELKYNENDERIIYSNDIRLIVRSTKDSVGKLLIERKAEGKSFLDAKKHAEAIEYNYSMENGVLLLDGFLTTGTDNKFHDQEVEITLYLPEGSILIANKNTYSYHRNDSRYEDILENGDEEKTLLILRDATQCIDCEDAVDEEEIETIGETSEMEEELEEELEDDFDDDTSSSNWKEGVENKFDEKKTDSVSQQNKTIVTDSINNQ